MSSSFEYITHHLSHNNLALDNGQPNFWAIHIDTYSMSLLAGFLFLFIFIGVARKAKMENPNKFQLFI